MRPHRCPERSGPHGQAEREQHGKGEQAKGRGNGGHFNLYKGSALSMRGFCAQTHELTMNRGYDFGGTQAAHVENA
jgi:hypothetical protein